MRGREIMEKEGSAIERYIRSTSDILPKGKHMRSIADIKELSAIHLVDGTDWFTGYGHHV